MSAVLARLHGVTRRFGSVTALAGADLEITSGEIHGVLGANGAGKTTLLSVLGGMLAPDSGRMTLRGQDVAFGSPRDAWAHGVALVHQHFTLVPALSVLENLALGRRSGWGMRLDTDGIRAEAMRLMDRVALSVPLDLPVEQLGVGDRQRTEILKALLRDPRILVLDEPTAVLVPSEIAGLFALLRELAGEGRAVVLVAHKLDEVLGVADRITVLRDGRTVLSALRGETSSEALVRAMVGDGGDAMPSIVRPLDASGADFTSRPGPVAAELRDVSVRGARGEMAVDGVSLVVRRGEITGIVGVEGNGQHELALVLGGRREPDAGRAELPTGIGFIPQDRSREGVVADFDLVENTALALQWDPRFTRGPWLDWGALSAEAELVRRRYHVTAPDVSTLAGQLSGGNQQRIVVGRELSMASDLLVAENPTRGLDFEATVFVHDEMRRLTEAVEEGPGVVLISTDLDEVLALAGRGLYAMSRGRLIEVPADRRTREGVGALMLASGDD